MYVQIGLVFVSINMSGKRFTILETYTVQDSLIFVDVNKSIIPIVMIDLLLNSVMQLTRIAFNQRDV